MAVKNTLVKRYKEKLDSELQKTVDGFEEKTGWVIGSIEIDEAGKVNARFSEMDVLFERLVETIDCIPLDFADYVE